MAALFEKSKRQRFYASKYVKVYRHCSFKQDTYNVALAEGKYYSRDLTRRGIQLRDISSLKVPKGYEVALFELDSFGGRSVTSDCDVRCLEDSAFNDLACSMVITRDTAGKCGVKMYRDCAFSGFSQALLPGRYDVGDEEMRWMGNDMLSSIKITSGSTVTLFKEEHFGGDSLFLDRNEDCLQSFDWNDQVSSLIVR